MVSRAGGELAISMRMNTEEFERATKNVKGGLGDLKGAIQKASMVATGFGAGLEALARSEQENTINLKQMAAATGATEDELRNMAASLRDATNSNEQLVATMSLGAKQGLKTAKDLGAFAAFWDTVGDATGENAEKLAEAGVALRSMGIDARDQGEALAAFGFISENTTMEIGEFLNVLGRVGPDLAEMGISVNETAGLLGVLESRGMTGRDAQRALTEAINKSDGSLLELLGSLGITTDEYFKLEGAVGESSGVIQRNADIVKESQTPLQELQAQVGALTLRYGGLIEQAAQFAPLLLAAGPAVAVFNGLLAGMRVAMRLTALAAQSMGRAIIGATGIGLAILAAWLLIENWDLVKELLLKAWEFITEKAMAVFGFLKDFIDSTFGEVVRFVQDHWDKILAILFPAVGLPILIARNWGKIIDVVDGIWDDVKDTVKRAVNFLIDVINGFIDRINSIKIEVPKITIPFVGTFGGFTVSMPQIPRIPSLDGGGIILQDTLAMVHRGEAVVPLDRLGHGGRGQTIIVELDGEVLTRVVGRNMVEDIRVKMGLRV